MQKKNLFYMETVVLCRWRSEVCEFGFKRGSNYHHKEIEAVALSFSPSSFARTKLEMSASCFFYGDKMTPITSKPNFRTY